MKKLDQPWSSECRQDDIEKVILFAEMIDYNVSNLFKSERFIRTNQIITCELGYYDNTLTRTLGVGRTVRSSRRKLHFESVDDMITFHMNQEDL